MRNLFLLLGALDHIEANLTESLSPESTAAACFCSLSALQKVFRYALHIGVRDYIDRRRLTQAAHALKSSRERVVDIALRFQYQSPEVFSRAFRRLWGVAPSAFRREWKFAGLYPRVEGIMQGGNGMNSRKLDISQLYEALLAMRDTVVLCFDIVNFMGINELGHEVGDMGIVECLKRIDQAAQDGMTLFRIGGDEFALLTGLTSAEDAEALARRILSRNGETFPCNGKDVPISMRAGGIRIGGESLRYAELFTALHDTIHASRESGSLVMPQATTQTP